MKVNQKSFVCLIVLGIFFQSITAGWEVRLSPKQYGLNQNSSDFNRSFFDECQAERAERQRQKYYAPRQELAQKEVRLRIMPPDAGSNKTCRLSPTNNSQSNNSKNNLPNLSTAPKSSNSETLPEDIKLKEILNFDYPKETQEQIITSEKITAFAKNAVEALKNKDTMVQGLDMLAITSMAHKLNKQNDPWLAVELIDQYLESSKLISKPEWTHDLIRRDLNIKLVNCASSISYASMLESKVPESLIVCSGLTSVAMELTRHENISLDIAQKLQAQSDNIISAGSYLAKIAISAEKRGLYLAFDYFVDPVSTSLKLFAGGVLGAARAVKNFNPIETVSTISHSIKDGARFLVNFVVDLGLLDHEAWLSKYDCSLKVSAICDSIENATTEQIGEIIGEGAVDQLLFDKTLKIIGKSLSILAASVKRASQPGTKIHNILTTLKDASEFSKSELEVIALSEGGAETIVFKEVSEEITKDLSNFNNEIKDSTKLANIYNFNKGFEEISKKFYSKTIELAKEAHSLNEYKIGKTLATELLRDFEKTCEEIKTFIGDSEFLELLFDNDHSFNITLNSLDEAKIIRSSVKDGVFKSARRSSKPGMGDFLDESGKIWDVKSPLSKGVGKNTSNFNIKKFMEKLSKEMQSGENILLNKAHLSASDYNLLEEAINNLGDINIGDKIKIVSYKIK